MFSIALNWIYSNTGVVPNDARNPRKVTLPNYKYFQKRIDSNSPGCRG